MSLDPDIFRRVEQGRATAEDYRALAQLHREKAAAGDALAVRVVAGALTADDRELLARWLADRADSDERVSHGYEEQAELAEFRAARAQGATGAVAP